jgi:hypothetical protein
VEEPEHGRWQGPVLRGERTATQTTDQQLLESRGATDWLHTDPWRVLRIQSEFIDGFGTLAELGPAVSFSDLLGRLAITPMYAPEIGGANIEIRRRRIVSAPL